MAFQPSQPTYLEKAQGIEPMHQPESEERMKVAVIGGGVAGAELVRNALPGPLDITLIEPKRQIEMQALYPEYLGGLARIQELTAPLKPFCDRVGATHVQEKALHLEENAVVCERTRVEFDFAVVATGAAQNYFGIKGVENTFSINSLEETKRARRFVEDRYPERIMIMGSGLTGVESATVLAESLDASIYIIEAEERVLPQFSPQTSTLIEKALSKKGVNVLTSTAVCEVREGCIMFRDKHCLDCDMAIWTAGVKPSSSSRISICPRRTAGSWWTPACEPETTSLPSAMVPGSRSREAGHQDRPGGGAPGRAHRSQPAPSGGKEAAGEVQSAGQHGRSGGSDLPGQRLRRGRRGKDVHRCSDEIDLFPEELDRQVIHQAVQVSCERD